MQSGRAHLAKPKTRRQGLKFKFIDRLDEGLQVGATRHRHRLTHCLIHRLTRRLTRLVIYRLIHG
jgi:hypothetical protein